MASPIPTDDSGGNTNTAPIPGPAARTRSKTEGVGRHATGVRSGMENGTNSTSDERHSRTSRRSSKDTQRETLLESMREMSIQLERMMGALTRRNRKRRVKRRSPRDEMTDSPSSDDSEVQINYKDKDAGREDDESTDETSKSETEADCEGDIAPKPVKGKDGKLSNHRKNGTEVQKSTTLTAMRPDKYDGSASWIDYFQHFEACRKINGWNDEEAGEYLAASLRGPALRLLREQKDDLSFNELTRRLANRFSDERQAENHLMELRQRKRRGGESLRELGQSIRELTSLAYPEFDYDGRDKRARGHFMDALVRPEIREGVFRTQAKTLDDMIHSAIVIEAFYESEAQREGMKKTTKFSRSIAKEGEIDPSTADNLLTQVMAMMENMKSEVTKTNTEFRDAIYEAIRGTLQARTGSPNLTGDKSDLECYYCKKKGHFQRDCRKRQRDFEQTNMNRRSNEGRPPQRGMARPNWERQEAPRRQ